jgi:hypothetical protein
MTERGFRCRWIDQRTGCSFPHMKIEVLPTAVRALPLGAVLEVERSEVDRVELRHKFLPWAAVFCFVGHDGEDIGAYMACGEWSAMVDALEAAGWTVDLSQWPKDQG